MNELELILTEIFNCSRPQLYLDSPSIILRQNQLKKLDSVIRQRAKAYPVAYILGYADFMGLRFKVNKDVLIPRPETEILVETIINQIKSLEPRTKNLRILDIGTGSGNIAVSLAKFLNKCDILAIDISKAALNVAAENALLNEVRQKIEFLHSDLFKNIYFNKKVRFDIIVSNPPYVPTDEVGLFDITTKKEPRTALNGGKDGLDFYRRFNKEVWLYLKKSGIIILEIGFNQADRIKDIFKGHKVNFMKDYQNIDRICIVRN